ncbi:DUF2180 family protein [bacterium]|nr:DUF2180 family protein [bacterium]
MKCYNHHDRDAFGICRICGKGLCLECMSQDNELGGIYCKSDEKCKRYAKFISKMFAYHSSKKNILMWIILGCIIAFFVGLLLIPAQPPVTP